VEQTLDPMALTVTLFGATNKPILSAMTLRTLRCGWSAGNKYRRYVQVIVEPKFKKWWGFDVRYEGSSMIIEIRKPWTEDSLRNMVIAIDPGHGGADNGAIGPHGTFEKGRQSGHRQNRARNARKIRSQALSHAKHRRRFGALRKSTDRLEKQARLFVSVHCNSSGLGENPLWTNGSSVYFYHPQSQALAEAIHAGYRKHVPDLPDRGLFYADFAVCRMTQMPAVFDGAGLYHPSQQEEMLFDPNSKEISPMRL